jgi:hypothetical protein
MSQAGACRLARPRSGAVFPMRSNHSLQATATRLGCGAWALRAGGRSPGGYRRPVRVAVPEFSRSAQGLISGLSSS